MGHTLYFYDLQTSPNYLTFIKVFSYYISSKYKVETILLRLRYLKGPYSGENIIKAIIAIIKTYKIISKIDYFVLNNARLNNIYISAIIK